MGRKLGAFQSWSKLCGEEKNSQPGFEPPIIQLELAGIEE
jgi:hypothetical protein